AESCSELNTESEAWMQASSRDPLLSDRLNVTNIVEDEGIGIPIQKISILCPCLCYKPPGELPLIATAQRRRPADRQKDGLIIDVRQQRFGVEAECSHLTGKHRSIKTCTCKQPLLTN